MHITNIDRLYFDGLVVYEVMFHAWTASIVILCKNGLLSQEGLQCQREEANEENHYAVAIVKRAAGCTENEGSWPQANQQHLVYI